MPERNWPQGWRICCSNLHFDLMCLITAAVLMAIFNFMMDAQVSFSRSMAIVLYRMAAVDYFDDSHDVCARVSVRPEGVSHRTIPCRTNPGFFMDPLRQKFLYAMLTSVWTNFISGSSRAGSGIGFALNAKRRF